MLSLNYMAKEVKRGTVGSSPENEVTYKYTSLRFLGGTGRFAMSAVKFP